MVGRYSARPDHAPGACEYITTHGRGAVAHLNDEMRALPPAARRRIEERMRRYVDLVRNTLAELQASGRLRDVDPTVAAFSVTVGVPVTSTLSGVF